VTKWNTNSVWFVFGQQPFVPLLLLGPPFFLIILFDSTTLSTGMPGISLHMQWPLKKPRVFGLLTLNPLFQIHEEAQQEQLRQQLLHDQARPVSQS
jgi:hypothetical protein